LLLRIYAAKSKTRAVFLDKHLDVYEIGADPYIRNLGQFMRYLVSFIW